MIVMTCQQVLVLKCKCMLVCGDPMKGGEGQLCVVVPKVNFVGTLKESNER